MRGGTSVSYPCHLGFWINETKRRVERSRGGVFQSGYPHGAPQVPVVTLRKALQLGPTADLRRSTPVSSRNLASGDASAQGQAWLQAECVMSSSSAGIMA